MTGDPYIDPQTGVLRNRLGITDADELTRVESDLTVVQLVDLERRHLPGRYDLPHLQEFHRFLFGDIYHWAGELRTVTIAKCQRGPSLPRGQRSNPTGVLRSAGRDAGYRIDWSTMDRETNLAASGASIRGNEAQLRAMLDQLVDQRDE